MKYPCLILKSVCKTPIIITIESAEIDENGAPVELTNINALCNYQGGARKYYNEQQQLIELSGIALLQGDIAPSIPEITGGFVILFNEKRRINKGIKARNPDGTVNYTKLELI